MTFFLTFVASDAKYPLKEKHIKDSVNILKAYNITQTEKSIWLAPQKAAEIVISNTGGYALIQHLREYFSDSKIDFFLTPQDQRRKKLLLADMDSTIVTGETLDDLAEYAGLKEKISAITARAMNGELDFHSALTERVGLLKDLPSRALDKTLAHIRLSAGAQTLVRTMKHHGATCVLVSGGFTFFTGPVAEQAGFDHHHGNTLDIQNDLLTGRVIPPVLDKFSKVTFLEHYSTALEIPLALCATIGDGANDIPMLKSAGLGVGYHPKPAVREALSNCILYGDLTALLYAQGYAAHEFS